MSVLISLIVSLFTSLNMMTAPVNLDTVVDAAKEVGAEEMLDFIRSTDIVDEGVTVEDERCLSIMSQLVPTIWESMGLGQAGELKSVTTTNNSITYNFKDGTSTTFNFDELEKMLK